MKIKYLGTAAAEGIPAIFCDCENCVKSAELGGRNIRTRSQALVDGKILIDFPADTYAHFLRYKLPLSKIKTCIVTHSHSDHLYAAETEMRKKGFAHIEDGQPIVFYSDKSGYEMLIEASKKFNISENDVKVVRISPFEPFEAEGYKITPVRAAHDVKSSPVIYAIEKEGKSMLYANDTSELCKESMECLKKADKPFDLVSLDCTEANADEVGYIGHMNLKKCERLREVFKEQGLADENTKFVLNHFSHNGKNAVYDEFVKIAAESGFETSYDGLEIEF